MNIKDHWLSKHFFICPNNRFYSYNESVYLNSQKHPEFPPSYRRDLHVPLIEHNSFFKDVEKRIISLLLSCVKKTGKVIEKSLTSLENFSGTIIASNDQFGSKVNNLLLLSDNKTTVSGVSLTNYLDRCALLLLQDTKYIFYQNDNFCIIEKPIIDKITPNSQISKLKYGCFIKKINNVYLLKE